MTVAYGKLYVKDKTGNILQIVPDATTAVREYQGATAQTSGVAGIVPAASTEQKNSYLKGDGTWSRVEKEVALMTETPTAQNTSALDNGSIIFQQMSQTSSVPVIHSTGDETIHGAKTFEQGPYSTVVQVGNDGVVNLSYAKAFTLTVQSGASLSFTGVPSGVFAEFILTVSATDDCTIEWPSNVRWESVPSAMQQGTDRIFKFLTNNGGTVWYGKCIWGS